jgi:phosphatidylinositol alpha-1,6-mannosyltransferase
MKRLLLLSSEFPPGPGGIGTHAYQLALHLTQLGWDVQVLTLQDYMTSEEIIIFNEVQKFKITPLLRTNSRLQDLLRRWTSLSEMLRNWKPDILVVTGDRQVWLAAVMQFFIKLAGRPYKLTWCAVWHGVVPPFFPARQLGVWAFHQADLIISVSQYSLEQLLNMGVKPRRQLVIENGADQDQYYPDPKGGRNFLKDLNLTDADVLLTVGHLSERKGQDIVIRALPEIIKSIPNVHYLMVGLPTIQDRLAELACELEVSEHVHFMGRLDIKMLNAAYNACDVFVLTSRHGDNGEFEGYGIVAVESALCAKPAVVAGNSGLAEAIVDGQTGFVVPENDSHAAAQAIRKLLMDPALKKQMGENARQRALREQTWSICMSRYDQALRQLEITG